MSQRKYILDLFTKIGILDCKPSDTLIEVGKRNENQGKLVDIDKYQRLVGKLICFSHQAWYRIYSQYRKSTRAFSKENLLGSCVQNSQVLEESLGRGFFKKSEIIDIKIFTDADWASSLRDRRSTTGYCTLVFENFSNLKK